MKSSNNISGNRRIIKTVRSNNFTPVNHSSNKNSDVFEKKTINVTHTVSSTTSPIVSQVLPRGHRNSNKRITVNRKIEGSGGYKQINRNIYTNDSSQNLSNQIRVSEIRPSHTIQKSQQKIRVSKERNIDQSGRYSNNRMSTTINGKYFFFVENLNNSF